jgi:glycosyltransferase involved in cell wall biosynthesis
VRILQLIDTLNPGGAERMCVNISNVLQQNGYDVQICVTRNEGALKKNINPEIKQHILNKKSSLDIIAFRDLIRVLKEERIDIIHAHSTSVFWAVFTKLFKRDLKVIWHDHLGRRNNNSRANIFYRLISSKIDAIISVSEDIKDWSRNNMKVDPGRIQYIGNFPLLRNTVNYKVPEIFTIVSLANLLPVKDHETLIRAIYLLLKEDLHKPVRVIFAGTYKKDEYYLKLKSLIIDLGLDSVIEIAGSVEDTAELLARADCGVLSSVSEGLPVSLLEYGLAALPVVVTDVGQCAEVTGNGKYGKVVPTGNPEAMSDALLQIIKNKDASEKTGAAFKEHIQKNYGPGNFMEKYKHLLNKVAINA